MTIAALILHTVLVADVGSILVATRKSHDPDLAKSVVLIVQSDRDGAIGLILNGRASEGVYDGGPIRLGFRALERSKTRPANANLIFLDARHGDVYQVEPRQKTSSRDYRVFYGYTGWSAQQLKDEISRGLWIVLPGDAAIVFDPNPSALWPRLIR
jgi:putative transcriptional regulator